MIQNVFYVIKKSLFVVKSFIGLVGKRLDHRAKVNLEIYDVINWETNNYNTNIAQYLKK